MPIAQKNVPNLQRPRTQNPRPLVLGHVRRRRALIILDPFLAQLAGLLLARSALVWIVDGHHLARLLAVLVRTLGLLLMTVAEATVTDGGGTRVCMFEEFVLVVVGFRFFGLVGFEGFVAGGRLRRGTREEGKEDGRGKHTRRHRRRRSQT